MIFPAVANPIKLEQHADTLSRLAASWPYVISAALILLFFTADVLLPRGATAAIGYCLVPVILGGHRPRMLLGTTILCTGLTAAGYRWESPGAEAWMSAFDRTMVGGVLWLTFFLVKRRALFMRAVIEQAETLRILTAELQRSNADLEQFASRVAHDLRGPLSAIGLLAQLLKRCGSTEDDLEGMQPLNSIKSELRRMSDFIQSLLNYGRAGARDIVWADCDCAVVLKSVKRSLMAEIDQQGAQITCNTLPRLRADPVLIGELFQNLIENSLKYHGHAPPAIHVSATPQPDRSWLFSVQDNGVGIREDDCAAIFQPFCQAVPVKSASLGVGLGLATCKRIVERHGGRIWIQSKLGDGTTFLFTIPQPAALARCEDLEVQR